MMAAEVDCIKVSGSVTGVFAHDCRWVALRCALLGVIRT